MIEEHGFRILSQNINELQNITTLSINSNLRINLDNCITDNSMFNLNEIISNNRSILNLDFSSITVYKIDNCINVNVMKLLSGSLKYLNGLESLNLSCNQSRVNLANNLMAVGVHILSNNFKYLKKLKMMDISSILILLAR